MYPWSNLDLNDKFAAFRKLGDRLMPGNVVKNDKAEDVKLSPSLYMTPCAACGIEMEKKKGTNEALKTALVYDEGMCKHADVPGCEISERIERIHGQLELEGLASKCKYIKAREATDEELLAVHTAAHIDALDSLASKTDEELRAFEQTVNSICVNQSTPVAARLAAGSLVDLCAQVVEGEELGNGFAVIRPPGHHCESCTPFGFCLYSNVAIAIRAVQAKANATKTPKILVVDWDVHHGNSTQHQFWHDPNVLYFSTHRYDNGRMFPGSPCGDLDRIGGSGDRKSVV